LTPAGGTRRRPIFPSIESTAAPPAATADRSGKAAASTRCRFSSFADPAENAIGAGAVRSERNAPYGIGSFELVPFIPRREQIAHPVGSSGGFRFAACRGYLCRGIELDLDAGRDPDRKVRMAHRQSGRARSEAGATG